MMELINGRCGNELFKTWRGWEVAWVVCVHSLYGCLVCRPGRKNSRFLGVELLTLTGSNFKRVQALTLYGSGFSWLHKQYMLIIKKKNQESTKLCSLEINNTSDFFSAYWFLYILPDFLMYVAIVTIVIIITDIHWYVINTFWCWLTNDIWYSFGWPIYINKLMKKYCILFCLI